VVESSCTDASRNGLYLVGPLEQFCSPRSVSIRFSNSGTRAPLATQSLNARQQNNLALLQAELNTVVASQPSCPGDGNGDGVVDALDLSTQAAVQVRRGGSSTYDFNIDGFTNDLDRDIINANLGPCPQP
jgi:hypothetical protein